MFAGILKKNMKDIVPAKLMDFQEMDKANFTHKYT